MLEAVLGAIREHYPEAAPEMIPMQVRWCGLGLWRFGRSPWDRVGNAWLDGRLLHTGAADHTREQAPEHFELEATTRAIEVGVRMSRVFLIALLLV